MLISQALESILAHVFRAREGTEPVTEKRTETTAAPFDDVPIHRGGSALPGHDGFVSEWLGPRSTRISPHLSAVASLLPVISTLLRDQRSRPGPGPSLPPGEPF